jgi:hypothetical protein
MRLRTLPLVWLVSFALPAAAQCPDWSNGWEAPGINGSITASVVFDDGSGPALYAAGRFVAGPDNPTGGIVRWNGTSWSAVGALPDGYMNALAVFDDGTGPKLCVGGGFFDPNYDSHGGVQTWNGQQWSQLGATFPEDANFSVSVVNALAVFDDGTGPHLYAGGEFGGVGSNIAKWNGARWVSVGGSLLSGPFDDENFINTLTVFDDGAGGGPALYAGGRFRFTGSWNAIGPNIARTYGSTWVSAGALGFAFEDGVNQLAVSDSGSGQRLVAAGTLRFSQNSSFRLAQWNGAGWTQFAADVDGDVTCMRSFDASSGAAPGLWVSGNFAHAGALATPNLARWDGAQWHTQGDNDALGAATSLDTFDDGSGAGLRVFALAGTVNAVLSNNHWSPLSGGAGANSTVTHLLRFDDPVQGRLLFATGGLSVIGRTFVNHFARWDGLRWTPELDFPYVSVNLLAALDDGNGTKVFASGSFGEIGHATARILRRDGVAWTQLPALPNLIVATAIATFDDGSGPHLFVGTYGYPSSSTGVWRLDGTSWTQVLTADSTVWTLAVFDDGSGPALFIGGTFTSIAGAPYRGIARWNGQTLSDLGGGTSPNGEVRALCSFDAGGGSRLHVGGHFTTMGGTPCSGLARWDGQAWADVGGGVQQFAYPVVYTLSVHDDGSGNAAKLVVGGLFSSVGGQSASDVATWDGAGWNTLNGGVASDSNSAGYAVALASFDDGNGHGPDLFVGGSFITAGGLDSPNIARLTSCGGSATTFCYGDGSATACPCGNASAIGARAGCLNSLGSGGTLRVSGRASVAQDTLELLGAGMTNSSALYYQGANVAFGGQGFVFGDGVKCVAGPFVRLRTEINANGASSYPNAGDAPISVKGFVTAPGTRHYQIHYRNSAAFCTPETFNNSNAVSVTWEH